MPAVPIATYDFGGEGPDLLLAHATGFHAHVWLPVVEHLRDRFHCWAFDERAHGASGKPDDDAGFDWHCFGEDALRVVDELGLERPYAAGHSCGSSLLLLAEMARPGTFEALWCYEPVIMPTDDPPAPDRAHPLAVGARKRRERFESKEAAAARLASKPPLAGFNPDVLAAYVEHGFEPDPSGAGVRLRCRGEDEARTYEWCWSHGAYSRLGEVGCPVALTGGEPGVGLGEEALRLFAARLPRATVSVLPGLTHFGPLEDPAAVAASIVAAFSASAAPAPGSPGPT